MSKPSSHIEVASKFLEKEPICVAIKCLSITGKYHSLLPVEEGDRFYGNASLVKDSTKKTPLYRIKLTCDDVPLLMTSTVDKVLFIEGKVMGVKTNNSIYLIQKRA